MLKLQHLVPLNHPPVVPDNPEKIKELMPYLHRTIAQAWTAIPHSKLGTFLQIKNDVPILAFRKNKREVYIHIFCYESYNLTATLAVVSNLYRKYKLGIPEMPQQANWIHTIPIPGPELSPDEVLFIHQITQSMFWTVHHDFKKSRKNILDN